MLISYGTLDKFASISVIFSNIFRLIIRYNINMRKIISFVIASILSFLPCINVAAAGDIDNLDQVTMAVDNVLFIGDSYCMGSGIADGPASGWAELTAKKMNIEHYYRKCQGGTGFIRKSDDRNFESLVSEAAVEIENPSSIEWIVIEGGYNDYQEKDEDILQGGLALIQQIHVVFPNAQILVGMNGWNSTDRNIQDRLERVLLAVQQIAIISNVTYIEDAENILYGHPEYMTNDHLHPNLAGQTAIAEHLAEYLQVRANAYAAEKLLTEQNAGKPVYTNTNYSFAFIVISLSIIGVAVIFVVRRAIASKKAEK